MPMYDKVILTEQARQLGFITASFEKMSRLTEVLRFLNDTDELRESLALKGGTAINLTVFNLPRLSVDIDLDFTENLAKEETRAKRDKIYEVLGRYMAAEGYVQKTNSKRTHILDSFIYSYTNVAENTDNIKVEINYSLRSHVLPTATMTARTSDVFAPFPVRTLAPVEIFASKIVALSDRAAARDLYDLNNMVHYGLFDETELTMLRKCAVFYLAVAGDIMAGGLSFARLADITYHKIKTDLLPMIRNAERFDFQAARKRVSDFLNEWMVLTENETAFLKNFTAGHYEPQLLFDDGNVAKRVENHPMAIWRLRHIRENQQEQ
ncbi:MAG: nucleotidyl transferase AbiEii/AbiGii toxin family protein [Oscillospiraceae bacterium]|jgi:predicted nucleotidyltransferase component of viral defense system|nr:nucleotidyl transferase AbiEii/AbiGii toxin family protein [Oscillospiraceae bacterium]